MSQESIDGFAAAGNPDAVVVGLDPNLTYARLAVASDSIRAGAHFIATNRDPVYPTERGLRPGAGSIVMLLEAATGVVPVSIGKPAPYLLEAAAACRRVATPAEAIMIGDGIATDLAAAQAVGARCVLMLTGVTTRAEVEALPADQQPTAVAADAAELAAALERLGRRLGSRARQMSASSGTPSPRPRTRRAPAPGRPRRRTRRRARAGRSPTARRSSARSISTALAYSSDRRDVGDRRVVRARASPARRPGAACASGCAATDGTIPACQFEVGHRSRVTPRAMSSAHSSGSSTAPGPCAIRSGLERQGPPDLRRRRPTRRRGG